jgi:hypothetical protein
MYVVSQAQWYMTIIPALRSLRPAQAPYGDPKPGRVLVAHSVILATQEAENIKRIENGSQPWANSS